MRVFRLVIAAGAAAALAACGGVGTSSPIPNRASAAPTGAAPASSARFVITWPQAATASSRAARRREYLSNSTASITIAVNGGTPLAVDNPNLSPGSSGTTQTTTVVNVGAPVGTDTFAVSDYDQTAGAGDLLASATIPYTIVADTANVVPITLNGNLAKFGCAPVGPFVSGTTAMTLVGPAGQVQALPEDAKGNIIVAPGAIPAIALASGNAAQDKVTKSSSGTNVYNVNVLLTGTAVTLDASGLDVDGNSVTGTACSITRVEALYVANQSPYGQNAGSVTIYPASATGDTKPTATIGGSYAELNEIQFVTVDSAGDVFVSNEGPMPGTPFGPTSGYVSVYAPGTSGNEPPIAVIPGFSSPEGVAVDSKDALYVISQDRIQVFPATANGLNGTTAVPSAVIAGSKTGLDSQYGLNLGTDGTIYTAGVNDIVSTGQLQIFAAGSTGNVAPTVINPPGATPENGSSQSWIGVAPDASGDVFTTAFNPTLDSVIGYNIAAATASTTAAAPTFVGAGFSQPAGLYIDIFGNAPTSDIFVGEYGSNTVESFTSSATLTAGVSNTSLTGADTGLNVPFGIYVR